MCLGIPAKVVEVRGETAVVEILGVRREVSILLTPDVKPGDYVIVHAGMAIGKLSLEEARKTLELLEEVLRELTPQQVR